MPHHASYTAYPDAAYICTPPPLVIGLKQIMF
jgi:hypothetical protein